MASKAKSKKSNPLLKKLRTNGDASPLGPLAELVVNDALERPLDELIEAERSALESRDAVAGVGDG